MKDDIYFELWNFESPDRIPIEERVRLEDINELYNLRGVIKTGETIKNKRDSILIVGDHLDREFFYRETLE